MNNTSQNRIVVINGEEMTSAVAAKKHNVTITAMRGRLKHGKTGEDLIKPVMGRQYYTYQGLTLSVYRWAQRQGVSYSGLCNRLNKGMSFEEAIEKEMRGSKKLYKGKWYSIKELSVLSGINYDTLKVRFREGWSVEDAVELLPRKWTRKST